MLRQLVLQVVEHDYRESQAAVNGWLVVGCHVLESFRECDLFQTVFTPLARVTPRASIACLLLAVRTSFL